MEISSRDISKGMFGRNWTLKLVPAGGVIHYHPCDTVHERDVQGAHHSNLAWVAIESGKNEPVPVVSLLVKRP